MHAGFPQFTRDISSVMHAGAQADERLRGFAERVGGRLLADGLALILKLGFGFVLRDGLLDEQRSKKARAFFEKVFVIVDPNAPGGERYYQGRFLIRTRRPGDDMNVLLHFCPKPAALFKTMPWGESLDPMAVVDTQVLTEAEADRLEGNPAEVDLVIRFKDVNAILGLVGRPNVDMAGLLLENLVQVTGNVGHMFKLGAIAAGVQRELGLGRETRH